jgi:hypothetical protein
MAAVRGAGTVGVERHELVGGEAFGRAAGSGLQRANERGETLERLYAAQRAGWIAAGDQMVAERLPAMRSAAVSSGISNAITTATRLSRKGRGKAATAHQAM